MLSRHTSVLVCDTSGKEDKWNWPGLRDQTKNTGEHGAESCEAEGRVEEGQGKPKRKYRTSVFFSNKKKKIEQQFSITKKIAALISDLRRLS